MKAKPLVLKASHFMEQPRILSWLTHDRDVRFVPKADIERLREKPAKAALVFEDRKRPHILTKDRSRKD